MSQQPPKVKRSWRYVVVRLTPDEARAAYSILHGLPAPTRQTNNLKKLFGEAREVATTQRPKSVRKSPGGLQLRKGDGI